MQWPVGIKGKGVKARELTFDETWELGSSLYTAEGGSSPCPPGNQLESMRRIRVGHANKPRSTTEITYGRVEISFPAAATPMTVETPHPL